MTPERQLQLPERLSLRKRESLARGLAQRRRFDIEQGKWGSQASMTFLSLAQSWKESEGSKIAHSAGQSVEDIAAEMGYLQIEKEFRLTLKRLKRADMSAKRVVGLMASETEVISRKTNDKVGWTNNFLDDIINVLGEEFRLSSTYVQKLKSKIHQRPLNITS